MSIVKGKITDPDIPQKPEENDNETDAVIVNGCYYFNEYNFQEPIGFDTREMQMKQAGIDTETCVAFGRGFYPCNESEKPSWPAKINVYGDWICGEGPAWFTVDKKLVPYIERVMLEIYPDYHSDMLWSDQDNRFETEKQIDDPINPSADASVTITPIEESGERVVIPATLLLPYQLPESITVYYEGLTKGDGAYFNTDPDMPLCITDVNVYDNKGEEVLAEVARDKDDTSLWLGKIGDNYETLTNGIASFKCIGFNIDIPVTFEPEPEPVLPTVANIVGDKFNSGDAVQLVMDAPVPKNHTLSLTDFYDGKVWAKLVVEWTDKNGVLTGKLNSDTSIGTQTRTTILDPNGIKIYIPGEVMAIPES